MSHPVGAASHARENNEFALAMFTQLRGQPGNLFFSPFGIRTALGMALAGARGETAAQIRAALRISGSDEAAHLAFAETVRRLNAGGGGKHEFNIANSLWAQQGGPLQPEFLDLSARHYDGGMHTVDFTGDVESVRATMNRWVEDRTRQRIRELVPAGELSELTRLVLINALHLKAAWDSAFDPDLTRDEPFHLEGGRVVPVPTMVQTLVCDHVRAQGYQAVELVYQGQDLSMLILLPDMKDGLPAFEARLSEQMLHDGVRQRARREVRLYLPRFRFEWGAAHLASPLAELGMPLAFSTRADFSGINGHVPPAENALHLSAVIHKAFVEANEAGIEAAAATAILCAAMAMEGSAPDPLTFRADHPFLFAIREQKTGAILFLGRVADPS